MMGGAVVIMGVSGCGKSTLGQALAEALGWSFVEGDRLHPDSNVAKMAAGTPLDDDDREPFLRNVAQAIADRRGRGVVAACSALKRSYRDLLRERAGDILFVLPDVANDELRLRLEHRSEHFMPPSLLDSQISALEQPGTDENAIRIDGAAPVAEQVKQTLAALAVASAPTAAAAGRSR